MTQLDAMATALASGTISVLITGETGSGKEVFAELIHRRSPRRQQPFVPINCAALAEGLLESELFGHERGAFTGALRTRAGLLESADGGTLLLDEVGEMPASLQAKLLRVLESREVLRVGANRGRPLDIRVVSATNRDLEAEVRRGSFRQDLFYRLCGATLRLPPLRERASEIELLARQFLEQAARQAGRPRPQIHPSTLECLRQHSWPGNVRELRNVMEWALLVCPGDELRREHLPPEIAADGVADALDAATARVRATPGAARAPHLTVVAPAPSAGPSAQASAERTRVMEALDRCAGNQTRAARLLGISRGTLISRLTEFGLPRPRKRPR